MCFKGGNSDYRKDHRRQDEGLSQYRNGGDGGEGTGQKIMSEADSARQTGGLVGLERNRDPLLS